MDKISSLVGRYSFRAQVFFNGVFCDANAFPHDDSSGQLHLVRSGPVVFRRDGAAPLRVNEPAMVFYPRGSAHMLEVPDGASATLLCAHIRFEDGGANPLARAWSFAITAQSCSPSPWPTAPTSPRIPMSPTEVAHDEHRSNPH